MAIAPAADGGIAVVVAAGADGPALRQAQGVKRCLSSGEVLQFENPGLAVRRLTEAAQVAAVVDESAARAGGVHGTDRRIDREALGVPAEVPPDVIGELDVGCAFAPDEIRAG